MIIRAADRQVARSVWQVAAGLILRGADQTAREAAFLALKQPSPSTMRELLALGRGKPWLPALTDALVEIGIAASGDVLSTSTLSSERWDQLHAAGGRIVIGIEDLTDDEIAIMLSQEPHGDDDE